MSCGDMQDNMHKHMPQTAMQGRPGMKNVVSSGRPMSQADMCSQGKSAMSKAKMSCEGGGSMG